MDEITEDDRGVFIIKTERSIYIWENHEVRGEVRVIVTRYGKPMGYHDTVTGRQLHTTGVAIWPVLGQPFRYNLHGDVPWIASPGPLSIERLI